MRTRSDAWHQSKNAKDRNESILRRSRLGVLARERKRLANPIEREQKLVRYYPLQLGVRDKRNGDTAWIDFKSVRDAAWRLSVIQKLYT
jgi:hypothetical protein